MKVVGALLFALSAPMICGFTFPTSSQRTTFSSPGLASFKATVETRESENMFFASTETQDATAQVDQTIEQRRVLGSQENLMLPRQYAPNPDIVFPQMNHVSCTILSATPSIAVLEAAILEAMQAHPLLSSHVEGDGEPNKRIDLFKMVRSGEPNPCTFVSGTDCFSASDILSVVQVEGNNRDDLYRSWEKAFNRDLDDGNWCNPYKGPLWKVELHKLEAVDGEDTPCALLFSFNHAISDQSSVNVMSDQIIANMAMMDETGSITKKSAAQKMPMALEDSVLGLEKRFSNVQVDDMTLGTVKYVASKAAEGLKSPVILPDSSENKSGGGLMGALTIISGNAAGGEDEESDNRKSILQFCRLSKESTSALLSKCRENGVTVTNALSAAVALTATDFIDNGIEKQKDRNYKVLQALDMRRFGEQLDKCETVACMAGSMDLMYGPLPDLSGKSLRTNPTPEKLDIFWNIAKQGKKQTADFIESGGPQEAVRVFDFAMTISDMNNLVYLTSQSKDSQGRVYSAGISNVGVYDRQSAVRRQGDESRDNIKVKHGKYEIEDIFFAVSHARSGCLYQASAMTVDGEMKCAFHPASPVISEETNEKFADSFMELLEIVAGTKEVDASQTNESTSPLSALPENLLTTVVGILGVAAVATHASAWIDFFQKASEMKANVADPHDFWAALNFWIFFAVGHPILQPILALSDVLHGSPGPKIADLVPATFVAGNVIVIAAIAMSKEIRNAVNIAAVAAFFTYVGAGLDGRAGLGDFNLALDDPYKGQIVKGCPAYDDVRQPSMDGFDIEKYQGKWYEHKFHDWTQFKEVYDTTLGIKLTEDGKGWIDDFAVKGPAPDAAPLSWDKSPVGNGAHYFLFGRVDSKDPPGVLRESGFGVEFPNYIVDVQKDPNTGEYTEAIQFQCLERGGVRVFEGINFMSRKPTMSDAELSAMHGRAERAGMFPYGASPEQMHTVARRPEGAPDLDNSWQRMWHNIGFDRLLELLTESIEDGGR